MGASYPTAVWNGDTPSRDYQLGDRQAPDAQDFSQVVLEIAAVQTQVDTNALDVASLKFITLTNHEASTAMVFGAPVFIDAAGTCKLARANAAGYTHAIGLCTLPTIATGGAQIIQFRGALTGAYTLWDAVTGQTGGLTAGASYYLDKDTAGKITKTQPTVGAFVLKFGTATGTQTLLFQQSGPFNGAAVS